MKPVSVTVRQPVQGGPERAFDTVIPVDLATIFLGYGPLPAVASTRDQVGDWDAAGNTRTVLLEDGGVMSEELMRVEYPGRALAPLWRRYATATMRRAASLVDGP